MTHPKDDPLLLQHLADTLVGTGEGLGLGCFLRPAG